MRTNEKDSWHYRNGSIDDSVLCAYRGYVVRTLIEIFESRRERGRMSMTLESAIIHAEEVADRCAVTDGYRQCEDEHRQLAAWLRELVERRKEPEVIRCNECAFCRPFLSDKVCSLGLLHNINSNMDFCSRAVRKPERRTDAQSAETISISQV